MEKKYQEFQQRSENPQKEPNRNYRTKKYSTKVKNSMSGLNGRLNKKSSEFTSSRNVSRNMSA